jgi:hypothetical protein
MQGLEEMLLSHKLFINECHKLDQQSCESELPKILNTLKDAAITNGEANTSRKAIHAKVVRFNKGKA